MGFFSKVFKKTTKIFKKVAKQVKKTANRLIKVVTKLPLVKPIMNAVGKLGPIGTIAMSMALPGIGTALAGFWSSTAASLSLQPGFFGALGRGMTWAAEAASTASGFVSKGMQSITDTIKGGFDFLGGGDFSKGVNSLFEGTQEFLGVKDPKSIQDVGKWIGEKAKKITGQTPEPLTEAQKAQGVFEANPELRSAFNQTQQARMNEIARNPAFEATVKPPTPVTELGDLEKARALFEKKPNLQTVGLTRQEIDQQFTQLGLEGTGVGAAVPVPETAQQFGADVFQATAGRAAPVKSNLASSLLKAAKGGFDFLAEDDQELPSFSGAGSVGAAGISQRLGIGGQGSAGGSLVGAVSPQLLQQLQQANQRLQQVG